MTNVIAQIAETMINAFPKLNARAFPAESDELPFHTVYASCMAASPCSSVSWLLMKQTARADRIMVNETM